MPPLSLFWPECWPDEFWSRRLKDSPLPPVLKPASSSARCNCGASWRSICSVSGFSTVRCEVTLPARSILMRTSILPSSAGSRLMSNRDLPERIAAAISIGMPLIGTAVWVAAVAVSVAVEAVAAEVVLVSGAWTAEAACALVSVGATVACGPACAVVAGVPWAGSAARSAGPALASVGTLSACGFKPCACAALAAGPCAVARGALPVSWPILEMSVCACAVAASLNAVLGVPWLTAAISPPLAFASVEVVSLVPAAASPSVVVVSASTSAPAAFALALALFSLVVAVSVLVPAICAAVVALAARPAAAIASGAAAASPAWFAAAFGSTGTTGAATMIPGSGRAVCAVSGGAAAAASTAAVTTSVPSVASPSVSSDASADLASAVSDLSLTLPASLAGSLDASPLSFSAGADGSVSSLALLCEDCSVDEVSRDGRSAGAEDEVCSLRRGALSCAGALLSIACVLLSTSEPKSSLAAVSFGACDRAGFCCALWICTLATTSDIRPTTGNPLQATSDQTEQGAGQRPGSDIS
nr:hypothetical protein BDOA9_0124390 [Bradyrhizobium sp. DOA9]